MKVLLVSPSFYPALHYGGPTHVNRAYTEALKKCERVELKILTTDSDGPRRIDTKTLEPDFRDRDAIRYCRRVLRPDIAPGLILRLPKMIKDCDVVHLMAVYSFTTIPVLALCRLMKKPVVWTSLGAWQRWSGSRHERLKNLWDSVCHAISSPTQTVLHMMTIEERDESVGRMPNIPAIIVRNGIDVPELPVEVRERTGESLRLLFIGRLHPIKGIENLLKSLTMVQTSFRLAICGDGAPDYVTSLRRLAADLNLADRVVFHGQVAGAEKAQQFLEADLCVVPSFKESFCAVIPESLVRGLPVIASRGTPWQSLETVGCGLWVSNEPPDLAQAIDRAATLPLVAMGMRGREWMIRDYSWPSVAAEMVGNYRSMIEGSRPAEIAATAHSPAG